MMAFYSVSALTRPIMGSRRSLFCLSRLKTSNALIAINTIRNNSSSTASAASPLSTSYAKDAVGLPTLGGPTKNNNEQNTPSIWPLQRLTTAALLRTIFLSRLFTSPKLSSFGLKLLQGITNSHQPFLDPDRNWLLNRILRAVIYNNFCSGAEPLEIRRTLASIKNVGYAGVILTYAREIVVNHLGEDNLDSDQVAAQQIQQWLDGNMQTLSMIDPGDYLAIKYTGAGGRVASALTTGEKPPKQFQEAMDKLCQQAQAQGSRIIVDAEQQAYQSTIDEWTVDVMRKYNRGKEALVLNTYQSYLKASRKIIRDHLARAQKEGWTLGIKVVRGAYISNDIRERIHDTKAETDASYNGIAHDLLVRSFDGITRKDFPKIQLFLAGHNADSIHKAAQLHRDLTLQGLNPGALEFGQLHGMADHVSGELLAYIDSLRESKGPFGKQGALGHEAIPRAYKCATWGTVRECLGFLTRRAVENQGAAERLQDGLAEAKRELKARIFRTPR
ncbi:FAD-linked oxidoreductase-like protein [Camillea tinctor]|nr:FAD-linked oxidoreductase-like protein [Camillea tinctor]